MAKEARQQRDRRSVLTTGGPPCVVAFVPLRMNSKRLPEKNLQPLAGKPLCRYIFEALARVQSIASVYAFCSEPAVRAALPEGVEFLRRTKGLDDDRVRGLEICRAFAAEVDADVYVLAHATSPFLRRATIERGLRRILEDGHDSAFTVRRLQTFAWFAGRPLNYSLAKPPRTQELEPVYVETSGFYIYRRQVLLQGGRRIGSTPAMVEVDPVEAVDIDDPEDLELARSLARGGRLAASESL